ncbi:MAG: pseudouridine synthase [Flavobacterium sp.]|nr:pseudouridine synthase [Flavobacterium sp.]
MLLHFKQNITNIPLPETFTFPFYYEPHELSKIAASELQHYLQTQTDFNHNFGLNKDQDGLVIGKMFGVLVVQNKNNQIGYLAAFSGKLADSNTHKVFVPPVFDMLQQDGFFKQEEKLLNTYNRKIEVLEKDPKYKAALDQLNATTLAAQTDIEAQKQQIKTNKQNRDTRRQEALETLTAEVYKTFEKNLSKESQQESIKLKMMQHYWKEQLTLITNTVQAYTDQINTLKEERKQKSAALQQKLFQQYAFLNQYGITKSLGTIFEGNPPASAGECAAPKLLHYAFQHQLKPIALAEFWWGQSPKSEVRKHGHFYPACTGKCKPILAHMLEGIKMDDNPLHINPALGKDISIVYEDEYLAVINKPAEFLSVPGKTITDSVYHRIKTRYPEATGPLIVHRLDMSTSGLLLISKSSALYLQLQSQFIKRTIKKRYVALLEGTIKQPCGSIELPLRVDLDNRPNQLVCYTYGKPAVTKWEVIEHRDNQTLVYFYPITGRTHQLRVHAAHPDGLNAPIVGDDLYGTKANRLHLHAEQLCFIHPILKKEIIVQVEEMFK